MLIRRPFGLSFSQNCSLKHPKIAFSHPFFVY